MPANNIHVSVLQMTSNENVEQNLSFIEDTLVAADVPNHKLTVLPENFAFMGLHESDKLQFAEAYGDGPIQKRLARLAKKLQITIIAGSVPIKSSDSNRCYAACLVFDEKGHCVSRYDKIHLFDVEVSATESHKESSSVCPGEKIVVVDTSIGRIGLSICYDIRFPELYRNLRKQGADIFIVPAAFTYDTGKQHWETLLKARAIENLSFVLASDQCGTHNNGRKTFGHSMIVSPWGDKLAECQDLPGLAFASIDFDQMHKIRQRFPCIEHQKLDYIM